jgi:NitT/TauT family transport system permease protein
MACAILPALMAQSIIPVRTPEGRIAPTPPRTASRWVDVTLFALLGAVAYGLMRTATRLSAPLSSGTQVDLNPLHLPLYAAYSTLRMSVAYVIALVFSIAYAKIAAASRRAERIMLPVLDILQSIPILSFMPGVVLGMAALIPGRTIGLELAAVLLIFTSQAWNLAFSFHQSLNTIPRELSEAATVYQCGPWRRFTRLELPFGAISLIANSMMSWAAAWFVLTASEQFVIGSKDLRLPGLGSYMQAAAAAGDPVATILGLGTLIAIIVLLDQVIWRPLAVWSDRFKFEQSGGEVVPTSFIAEIVNGSALLEWLRTHVGTPLGQWLDRVLGGAQGEIGPFTIPKPVVRGGRRLLAIAVVAALAGLTLWGAVAAVRELTGLPLSAWRTVWISAGATFLRTLIALVISAAWTIPVGVAIGFNPRLSARAQPFVQIAASVPANMLFPIILVVLLSVPGGLNIASVLLMLLGTQWYVLFNVIAGAMAIPSDLREAATVYNVSGWRRWRTLILPAIFPYLVTGMITATGGAWNASVVSEYVTFKGQKLMTVGLGSLIADAADRADFPLLLAGTLVMAAIVITVNRVFWRRLYALAEARFRLD